MSKSGPIVVFGERSDKNDHYLYVKEEDFQILAGEESFGIPLEQLMKIEKSKINSKSFLEYFSFSDFSFWWFLHPTIYPKIKKSINFIQKFQDFLIEKNPSKVIVNNNFLNLDLIEQICKKHNVELEKNFSSNIKNKIFNSFRNNLQEKRYQKIYSKKIKKRKSIFHSKVNKIFDIQDKIIFAIPTIYHRKLIDHVTGNSYNGEYIQQNIIDYLKNDYGVIGIDLDYTLKGNFEVLKSRLDSNLNWIPGELFLLNSKDKSIFNFLKNYNIIIKNKIFQNLFQFEGISLWNTISYTFKMMNFESYIPSYLKFYLSLDHIFKEKKPKVIFLSYETGPYGLAIILAAQKNGIKTVGVAHGAIDKYNPMYSYDQIRNTKNSLGFPIPDIMLVHGEFSKNTLIEQGYPQNQIVVYGNTTFFNLDQLKNSLNQKTLFQKYGISEDQKVILYGTEFLQEYYSSQGKYNYNSLIWKNLLENFGNNSDYVLILKSHPNENTSIYEKILDDFHISNAKIVNDDLFELIHLSSIVVSVFSNIMTDALCFDKPVIRVTFNEIEHTVPYEKFGVIQSTNIENLTSNIVNLLTDNDLKLKLKINLKQFLKEQNNIPEKDPELILDSILK
jgi:CDP-glycerol glycerophosphotransferase (TagB/SpsB family)